MKAISLMLVFVFSLNVGLAQEKTKKQIKEEQSIAKQKEIQVLLDSKEFEFVADMAYPQGTRNVSLTSNPNYLRIIKDTIVSEMPYFGRAFAGAGYGDSGGLDFKGPMLDYSIVKNKKDHTIKAKVKTNSDFYTITLIVFLEGNASLTINSNKRSMINYRGVIDKIKNKK